MKLLSLTGLDVRYPVVIPVTSLIPVMSLLDFACYPKLFPQVEMLVFVSKSLCTLMIVYEVSFI